MRDLRYTWAFGGGIRARGSAHGAERLFHWADATFVAQERRADGGASGSVPCQRPTPIVTPLVA